MVWYYIYNIYIYIIYILVYYGISVNVVYLSIFWFIMVYYEIFNGILWYIIVYLVVS